MPFYSDREARKDLVRKYIREHPNTTYKQIERSINTKINRVYAGGLNEAYDDSGVPKPRTMKFKTKDERRQILIDYIRKNPKAGGHIIKRDTKINLLAVFKNTKEAFEAAGLSYPNNERRLLMQRSVDEKRNKILSLLRENPLMGLHTVGKILHVHPHSFFKDTKEMYCLAGVPFIGSEKRRLNKVNLVTAYIRKNNFATQREVNRECKTKVQELFENGIFDAYKEAGIPFPFKRLNIHGITIKEIRDSAIRFEEEIAKRLSGYGTVSRLVKTRRGRADIVLERNGKKFVFELKNYKSHEISISQIKQLNKYLEDINVNIGFLICFNKPKKDTFLMGQNRIFVLTESELHRIPAIMDP